MRPPRSQRCEDNTRVIAQKIAPGADNGIYTERSKKLQTRGQQNAAADAAQQGELATRKEKTKEREKRGERTKFGESQRIRPFREGKERTEQFGPEIGELNWLGEFYALQSAEKIPENTEHPKDLEKHPKNTKIKIRQQPELAKFRGSEEAPRIQPRR